MLPQSCTSANHAKLQRKVKFVQTCHPILCLQYEIPLLLCERGATMCIETSKREQRPSLKRTTARIARKNFTKSRVSYRDGQLRCDHECTVFDVRHSVDRDSEPKIGFMHAARIPRKQTWCTCAPTTSAHPFSVTMTGTA